MQLLFDDTISLTFPSPVHASFSSMNVYRCTVRNEEDAIPGTVEIEFPYHLDPRNHYSRS